MKIIELDPEEVTINPVLAARKGAPDEDDVASIAQSMLNRAESGMEPYQMLPAIVRMVDGKYELIDGNHRLKAVMAINAAGGINGEPMKLSAQVFRANDENGLISAIQANFHIATDVFDRADAMGRMSEMGKKNNEIAQIFQMAESSVSAMLKLNQLPKKYAKAVKDGDIEQDAAVLIADLDTDDKRRQEIFEECIRHRQKFEEITARREQQKEKAAVAEEIEAAKAKVAEAEAKVKDAQKTVKEIEKTASKTEGTEDLEKVRKEKAEAEKLRKAAEKEAATAAKELEKAKKKKEQLTEQAAAKKSKATVEDVREAAANKGVNKLKGNAKNKAGKTLEPTPRTKAQLIVVLEAMGKNEKKPLPEKAQRLIGKIEEYLDGDCSETQLENSFRVNCG